MPEREPDCTCVVGEACDEEGDPGCAYCRSIDCEWPCPAEEQLEADMRVREGGAWTACDEWALAQGDPAGRGQRRGAEVIPEFTMEQRLRWHYSVARMKGAPLTDRDRGRLDDFETLLALDDVGEGRERDGTV